MVYIDSVKTSSIVYLSNVRSSSTLPCYRARRGRRWRLGISSVARALQGARRKGRAGRWRMETDGEHLRPPTRLEPAAARSDSEARARARRQKRLAWRTHARIKGGPSQVPEEAAPLRSPFSGSPGYRSSMSFLLDLACLRRARNALNDNHTCCRRHGAESRHSTSRHS